MSPDLDGIPIDEPIHAAAVFDMVYNPEVTRLLARARDQGKRTIPGTVMFAAQAARQFEIWTGRPADPGAFRMGAS
jgi:shikimate 5-dehydrogenase